MTRDLFYEDVAIDSTGVLQDGDGNDIQIKTKGDREVALHLEAEDSAGSQTADAEATYQIEVGVHRDDGSVRWYTPGDLEFTSTNELHEDWIQRAELLRVRVTTAATADATADIYLAVV